MAAELAPLKLDAAKFRTVVAEAEAGPEGAERVEFEIATNPGAPFAPLIKIASGGELSRFILALKVALAATGSAGTLIFDEIDRGVGGAVASAIGERLARLSGEAQVLVVTHSPQVAARGAAPVAHRQGQRRHGNAHRGGAAVGRRAARGDCPHAVGRRCDRRSAGAGRTPAGALTKGDARMQALELNRRAVLGGGGRWRRWPAAPALGASKARSTIRRCRR